MQLRIIMGENTEGSERKIILGIYFYHGNKFLPVNPSAHDRKHLMELPSATLSPCNPHQPMQTDRRTGKVTNRRKTSWVGGVSPLSQE